MNPDDPNARAARSPVEFTEIDLNQSLSDEKGKQKGKQQLATRKRSNSQHL
jgi:hypothetical protein